MLLQAGAMKIGVVALVVTSILLSPAGMAKKSTDATVIAAAAAPGLPGGRIERTLTRNPDELDVFYQAPNGALGMNWAVGPWSTPSQIAPPGAGRPNSPIAAAVNEQGFLQAFYVQPDGAIGSAMQVGRQWRANAITQVGLVRGDSPLTAAKWGRRGWIFFVTPRNSVAGMDEQPVTATASHVYALEVVSASSVGNGSGLAFIPNPCGWSVFYQAVDGALVEDWSIDILSCRPVNPLQKTTGRQPIVPPGVGNPQTPIAVLTRGNDQLHVFFVRPDSAVATTWKDGQHSWASPFPITPPGAARGDSPLAAVVRGGDQLHVFYIARDGAIATTWAVGPWAKPFAITPAGAAGAGSRLAAVLRRDQLHVFYQGSDGAIATNWAVGPWQTPSPITPPGAGSPGSSITVVTGR
ncbi:MAG: hypothetical protein QN168_01210 [Armatimonadota bacterium]|nr:hypothetical protein [Armatimonadota bacterium]